MRFKTIDKDSIVYKAVQNGISIFAAHTNMDVVEGGVNDALAQHLGVLNCIPLKSDDGESAFGCIGQLEVPFTAEQFAKRVQEKLNMTGVRVCGPLDRMVEKVVVACGSGGDRVSAAGHAGADALITGEAKHNYYMDAINQDLVLVEAGHYHTEKHFVNLMAKRLQAAVDKLEYNLEIKISERGKPAICDYKIVIKDNLRRVY